MVTVKNNRYKMVRKTAAENYACPSFILLDVSFLMNLYFFLINQLRELFNDSLIKTAACHLLELLDITMCCLEIQSFIPLLFNSGLFKMELKNRQSN